MIGQLRGKIIEKHAPSLLLDVGGVGYEIDAPMTTFYQLPESGSEVTLHTHLVVREDAHCLYGFISKTDRTLFRKLIKISGVGAKLALALLSGKSANELITTFRNKDIAYLIKIPGVGKKTAERLVIEMSDRLKDWQVIDSSENNADISNPLKGQDDAVKDALSALIALGYKPQEASLMIQRLDVVGCNSEEIIRQALKSVSN